VRRSTVLLSIVLLAGALVARRLRRSRTTSAPLATPPPAALLPAPAEPRFVSVAWELVDAPADAPRLTIRVARDERMELERVEAQETPTQVFVTALLRHRPATGGALAVAQQLETTVPLSAPLGTRELVHAPVDAEAPAGQPGGEPNSPPLYP